MTVGSQLIKEQFKQAEQIILQQSNNFQALFMAVGDLNDLIKNHPENCEDRTIQVLETILNSNQHVKQSKSFFLYRETAITVVSIIKNNTKRNISTQCISLLKNCIANSSGDRLRAVAEAAGSLPLKIRQITLEPYDTSSIPSLSFNALLKKHKIHACYNHRWLGRSLVSAIDENNILIIKMAKQNDNLTQLNMENGFMSYLTENFSTELKFNIPLPIKVSDHYLFSISELPIEKPDNVGFHENNICIGFIATKEYFAYPNEKNDDFSIDEKTFQEIIFRSSALFAQLSGEGLPHTAPVPLFHNRVQQDRRDDGGIYDWAKGGRLDQWLESCRFPNFGESGIRDFEHFDLYSGNSLTLYKHIGSHILSLILVAGSFYRNIGKDNSDQKLIGKSGFDKDGNPINAKELFNESLLPVIIETLIQNYHNNFTGKKIPINFSFDYTHFSTNLINEMGVDKHMEEVLRTVDQKKMSEKEFADFLLDKEFKQTDIGMLEKGKQDIITPTGPHLGGFNQKISIPLLPELLAKISSFCIIDKFEMAS